MAEEHTARPTDVTGIFGNEIKCRITQIHASPGFVRDEPDVAPGQGGRLPPLAKAPIESAPLVERFRRGRS